MRKVRLLALALAALLLCGCGSTIKDGVALLEEEKYEAAISVFTEEIEEEKNLDEAYRGIGIAYFELEEYQEAADAFENALKHEAEETAVICSFLGASYIELGNYEASLEYYEKALAKEDCTETMKQEIAFNLIAVYENLGDWESAKTQMQEYVEAYPDDTRVEKEAGFLETR